MTQPRLTRRDDGDRPRLFVVEKHEPDCDCAACEPYVPSVAPRLGFVEIGRIAAAALVFAHVVACVAWGPATVWHILIANLAGRPL